MHDLDAGRIFWRNGAQRSFWLALIGMSVGLDVLLTFVTIWNQLSTASQLGAYNYVAIVLACSFATGSAAIAFAGEIEGKTYGLLQRLPLRTRDLFIGKFALSTVGSYLLLLVAWVAGQVILSHASPGTRTAADRHFRGVAVVFLHAASAAGVRGGWRSGFRRVQRSSLDLANCRNCDGDPVRGAGDSQKSGISSVHHCTCDGLRFLPRPGAGCTTPVRSDRAYSLASRGRRLRLY